MNTFKVFTVTSYFKFLRSCFLYNAKLSNLVADTLESCIIIGIKSIFIFAVLSGIVGVVCGIHVSSMLDGLFMSDKLIPVGLKNLFFLEFCPTIMCIVYIGQNMTSITGKIYTMRSLGHLDDIQVMGVNVASYTCLPKIIASVLVYPLITILSCVFALLGAALYCTHGKDECVSGFMDLCISVFNFKYITLCMVKSIVFGFLCGSIATYVGYCYSSDKSEDMMYVSQRCFTMSCVIVLISDTILNLINYYLTSG